MISFSCIVTSAFSQLHIHCHLSSRDIDILYPTSNGYTHLHPYLHHKHNIRTLHHTYNRCSFHSSHIFFLLSSSLSSFFFLFGILFLSKNHSFRILSMSNFHSSSYRNFSMLQYFPHHLLDGIWTFFPIQLTEGSQNHT